MTDYTLLTDLLADWNEQEKVFESAGGCGKMIAEAIRLCSGQLTLRIVMMAAEDAKRIDQEHTIGMN